MFSSAFVCLFVCLLAGLHNKPLDRLSQNLMERRWKKPLDFGGNPDHVTLRSGLGSGLGSELSRLGSRLGYG